MNRTLMKERILSLGIVFIFFFTIVGNSLAESCLPESDIGFENISDFRPEFELLNGNIFMVAQLPELEEKLANGSKIEFVFGAMSRKSLLHIETTNATMITQQEYDILALVPSDVARALQNNKLRKIIIRLPGGKKVIKVKNETISFTAIAFIGS